MVAELGDRPQSELEKYAVAVIEQLPARHRVAIEFEQAPGVIGAGPITGAIRDAWVEYDGVRVTEVPEGEYFSPKVSYYADNPGACQWGICVTVIDTANGLANYAITGTPAIGCHTHLEEGDLDVNDYGKTGPMPNRDVTLRFKLWGNQEKVGTPPYPQSEWATPA